MEQDRAAEFLSIVDVVDSDRTEEEDPRERAMAERITQMWKGLRDAGVPEVMLYLPDGSASRCHWDDTTMVGSIRVALLGDQDRGIVRLMPIEACVGIGVPSPKGTDPMMYRGVVRQKLAEAVPAEGEASEDDPVPKSVAGAIEPVASMLSASENSNGALADSSHSSRAESMVRLPSTTAGQWPATGKLANSVGIGSGRS
ncbi:MAG: hypothetical protein NVSMB14_11120 [Isosphaeraceae bacterium]